MKIDIVNGYKTRMLEKEFAKGERTFTWVKDYFLLDECNYHLYKATFHKGTDMEYSSYELFRSRTRKKHPMDTHTEYTHTEVYPSDEDFGYYAWSLTSQKAADEKIFEFVKDIICM